MTTNRTLQEAIEALPAPLDAERYEHLRHGIYDADDISVYVNEGRDFAFLFPAPAVDYSHYQPRSQKLGLTAYKKKTPVFEWRYEKIAKHLADAVSILEIGAADGNFLEFVRKRLPDARFASLEKDMATKPARDALKWLTQYEDLSELEEVGAKFQIICLFHVFEHILDPGSFLMAVRACLAPGGRVIIEVPSLDDPLLNLFASDAYQNFYFQKQHPYVYRSESLARVLRHHGFKTEALIAYQRYGLENHLNWLVNGQPGGNDRFRSMFADCDAEYLAALERSGIADTVITVATADR